MTFLTRIMRFLFWLLVVSWSVWLLRRTLGWLLHDVTSAAQPAQEATEKTREPERARLLVRDPVCGMHVDEALSVPLREDGELLHFCSLACRDAYIAGRKKFAANG